MGKGAWSLGLKPPLLPCRCGQAPLRAWGAGSADPTGGAWGQVREAVLPVWVTPQTQVLCKMAPYFWSCWVFIAACRSSLVAENGATL